MKPGTPDILKFKRLHKRLGGNVRGIVGLLDLLWQRTAKEAPAGDIGRFTNEEIALLCDWDETAPDELVDALVETGWLDVIENHRLVVHDWHDHCPSYLKGNFGSWGKTFASKPPDSLLSSLPSKQPSSLPPTEPNLTDPTLTDLLGSVESTIEIRLDPERLSEAVERANKVLRRMVAPPGPRDRAMVAKAAKLSFHSPYNEAWLYDGVEAVLTCDEKPRRPWAYLRTAWTNYARDKFKRDLAADFRAVPTTAQCNGASP